MAQACSRLPKIPVASIVATALAFHESVVRATAHRWIDCIDYSYDVVYTNSERCVLTSAVGHGVCEEYACNFSRRCVASISTNFMHQLLPADIGQDDAPVCQYHAQDASYSKEKRTRTRFR